MTTEAEKLSVGRKVGRVCRPEKGGGLMRAFRIDSVLLCAMASLCAAQIPARQTVSMGEWAIQSVSFDTDTIMPPGGRVRQREEVPLWRGTARKDGASPVRIVISPEEKAIELFTFGIRFSQYSRPVEVAGVDEARFEVLDAGRVSQEPSPVQPVCLQHRLACRFHDQFFAFDRTVDHGKLPSSEPSERKYLEGLASRAVSQAPSDPLITFAQEFFRSHLELGTCGITKGYPTLKASIDGGTFTTLKRAAIFKDADYAWDLPAHPGQSVALSIQFPATGVIATTDGLRTNDDPGALAGRHISLDTCESAFDDEGIALLRYGTIQTPHKLVVKYRGWRRDAQTFTGNIFLRWGRPEEAWLANNYYPLAPKVSDPTPEACIRAVLQDLESAFDFDLDRWLTARGAGRGTYDPDWIDCAALEGLDLAGLPHLQTLDRTQTLRSWLREQPSAALRRMADSVPKTPLSVERAKMLLQNLASPEYGPRLWEDLTPFAADAPCGWHSPQSVYVLACLWKGYPVLRQDNPLEKTLDYWVDAIAKSPDPVGVHGKGTVRIEHDLCSHGYAAAALHLGHELLSKIQYEAACKVQMERLNAYMREMGFQDAMMNRAKWTRERQPLIGCPMCEAISLYGQTAAFVEDKAALEHAQRWIQAALAGTGPEGNEAFRNYESATFRDRCGMIAVLRSRAAYLSLPFVPQ
jgi:hypothetical protein